MLSYRHSFHAGNHADVLKHIIQTLIIEALKQKEKPFLYLDTHAGAGMYQLTSAHSERTAEYLQGVACIWPTSGETPAEIAPYLQVLAKVNRSGQLRYYPGSPVLAQHLLRPQDQLLLSELHPTDFPLLRHEMRQDKRVTVLQGNGYQLLKSRLPPVSRRGFILLDPSYELKSDYQQVVSAINEGYQRFATGCYALWYPVVLRQQVKKMIAALKATEIRRILQIELAILPDNDRRGMTAYGMIVINPPWRLSEQMEAILPWLHHRLSAQGYGHYQVNWITPE